MGIPHRFQYGQWTNHYPWGQPNVERPAPNPYIFEGWHWLAQGFSSLSEPKEKDSSLGDQGGADGVSTWLECGTGEWFRKEGNWCQEFRDWRCSGER